MAGSILAVSKGYKSKLALLFRIADDDKQHQDRAVIRGINSRRARFCIINPSARTAFTILTSLPFISSCFAVRIRLFTYSFLVDRFIRIHNITALLVRASPSSLYHQSPTPPESELSLDLV
jgi:hypothetical protein